MNSGRVMNLRVTIPAESRRMNVGKDVIRILGSPAYICVLQRKDRKSIAITPCAAEHPMMPKKEQYGQIYAEKFTSASLICKAFYGKMEAQ